MIDIANLVRDNVKSLKPFSSARAEFTGRADVFLDANESPFESDYNRYPDPYQKELKKILGGQKGIQAEQIIFGNGSDEIIDLLVRVFCTPGEDIIRIIYPSFGMYEVVGGINDVGVEKIDLNESFQLDVARCLEGQTTRHKILFLCSPNNPTGNSLNEDDIEAVLDGWKGIVVIDEAYIEFSDRQSFIPYIEKNNNLVILQTFSKAMGGAGLRLGMGFSSTVVIDYLNKIKPPYNVNNHTQKRAKSILSQGDIIEQQVKTLKQERSLLISNLEEQSGVLNIYPSDTNFLLIKFERHIELFDFLMEEGIVIRDRSKLRGCEQCLRITIGMPKENAKLLAGLRSFYN